MNVLYRKAIASALFLTVMIVPSVFLAPGIFRDAVPVTAFVFLMTVILADVIIRPIAPEKDRGKKLAPAVAFFLLPVFVILPYLENTYFIIQYATMLDRDWVKWTGVVIMALGAFVLLTSRLTLGRFGSPTIVIQKKHRLVRAGLYRYVRHPLYLGDLILFFGYCLAFCGYLSAVVEVALYFLVILQRMNQEEEILEKRFGAQYRKYKKESDRLIPGIY